MSTVQDIFMRFHDSYLEQAKPTHQQAKVEWPSLTGHV